MFLTMKFGFSFAWGSKGSGTGQFAAPTGIGVDSSGNVYVADYGNHRIQKFDSRGNYLAEISGVGSPTDVAVDASDNVYISDESGNRILKYDSSFTLITTLGSYGNGDYQFDNSTGVTLDASDEFLYVADNGNNRIMKFNSSLSDPGSYVMQWGAKGAGSGQFDSPVKVAIDLFGRLYVTDFGNNRIQEFDSSGNYLSAWGSSGSGSGEFNGPMGIAAGVLPEIPPFFEPPPPSPLPYVIVADSGNNRCQFTGGSVGQFGSSGSKNGQFKAPYGIAVGEYIYVVDSGNNRVEAFGWKLVALPRE
jgi:DNA-binding beta-propeller fold protein YncE